MEVISLLFFLLSFDFHCQLFHSLIKHGCHFWVLIEVKSVSTVVDIDQKVADVLIEIVIAEGGKKLRVHQLLCKLQVFGTLPPGQVFSFIKIVNECHIFARLQRFKAATIQESAQELIKHVEEDFTHLNSECQIANSHILVMNLLKQ